MSNISYMVENTTCRLDVLPFYLYIKTLIICISASVWLYNKLTINSLKQERDEWFVDQLQTNSLWMRNLANNNNYRISRGHAQ